MYSNIKSYFADWKEIKPGDWSACGPLVTFNGGSVEVGLYREPSDNNEYANTYTLQVFINDVVVLCKQVMDANGNLV